MGGREILVGVAGAGTMGAGIAQVAAAAGNEVVLLDVNGDVLSSALKRIEDNLARQVEKGKMSREIADAIRTRISTGVGISRVSRCDFVVEAISENLKAKQDLLYTIEEAVSTECILGTNTSSLSVTSIASILRNPSRCLGVHFFNPAVAMPLVELVRTGTTSDETFNQARALLQSWGKIAVAAKDTPGFIVNRITRPFYLEALKIHEEGAADIATIDWAMRECKGFKMGPFELMDLIGNDINYAVSESIFAALHYEPRFKPSPLQHKLVKAGLFGRKSGKGFYNYQPGAPKPQPREDRAFGEKISHRILLMILNEAADALSNMISSIEEIDLAMVKAASYPRGPLQWADEIGIQQVVSGLEALRDEFGDDRYRPTPLLKRMVKTGERFYTQ